MSERPLRFGEALPHLHANSNRNPRFSVGSMAGRFVLLMLIRDVASAEARAALEAIDAQGFDEGRRLAALVCLDKAGEGDPLLQNIAKTKLVFWDFDGQLTAQCGLNADTCVLLDPTLRVLALFPLGEASTALKALAGTPEPDLHAGVPLVAPVLIVPRVFEPGFCKKLIEAYEKGGAQESGTTKEDERGITYVSLDADFKRRTDYILEEKEMRDAAMHRIFWRLLPQLENAFSFKCTRIERYLVACYDQSGGFFRAHRDNTTKGTAHRRFAVTINLNAEDYEGGDLRFPEFGQRTYRAPTGGAVVFSCALLHEATPVTRGRRFAFLPFLYDEAAAKVREENLKYLDESLR